MPSIPPAGFNGTPLGLAHANSRDGFASIYPSGHEQWHLFEAPYPTIEPRALGDKNATIAMAEQQRLVVRAMATSISSISLASALLAVYWFYMMRRNFRRDLVLLLILGGSWKSLWFLVFSAVTVVHGSVSSDSAFCQASGYFLLLGFESCDIAIVFMSMHMCLQIFPRARGIFGNDGLYPVRKWVAVIWFVLPHVIAGLAFTNPDGGFVAQGPFCFLPVRPFWYRLALFWIPRYLIWFYITYVAIRIYRHVGTEFKVFGQERDRSSSLGMPGESSIDRARQRDEMKRRASQANAYLDEKEHGPDDGDSCAPDDISTSLPLAQRSNKSLSSARSGKDCPPEWLNAPSAGDVTLASWASRSMPTSRRGSRMLAPGVSSEDFAPLSASDPTQHRGSVTSLGSKRSAGHTAFADDLNLPSINEGLPSRSAAAHSDPGGNTANKAMDLRRRAIQRQLRLLFIYPCVYMMLWVIPFAVHCMNYTNHYAHHPIFGLNVVQIFCMNVMTLADVVVFSWREKPWRHIPGSDGTFWGSLCWWRYALDSVWIKARRESRAPSFPGEAGEKEKNAGSNEKGFRQTRLLASIKRWSLSIRGQSPQGCQSSVPSTPPPAAATARPSGPHKRTYSGGSDRKFLDAERAHERLALERADYEQNRRSLQDRRASVISGQSQSQPQRAERRDWFDRGGNDDLMKDPVEEEAERRGTV